MSRSAQRLPRGLLVAIEGIDGCGKSTQARLLAERLAAAELEVLRTREPTDGPHGRRLRASAMSGRLPARDELDAFVADRREHVRDSIGPALAAGKIVIVDRYYFSTAAYQGARGLDPDEIVRDNETFAPVPDLLVLLEVPLDDCLRRIAGRDETSRRDNLFELADDLRRVQAIFDRVDRPFAVRLDGTSEPLTVHERIVRALDDRVLADLGVRAADTPGPRSGARSG